MTARTGDGVPGFSDQDLPLAAGSLAGVRLWQVDLPSAAAVLNGTPARVEGLLAGVFGSTWQRGENVAVCGGGHRPSAGHLDPVPALGCGCGFWAYWTPRNARRTDYYWRADVIGIMQGYGRTRIGTRGCRCGKARILALHVTGSSPDFRAWGLPRQDVAGILGRYYGVPWYPSLPEMLAAHPPSTDYSPRRRHRRLPSPVSRPTSLARTAPPVNRWRVAGFAAACAILAGAVIMLAALWGLRAVAVAAAIVVASAVWPIGMRWLPHRARK
jgi:hypothetical protein